MQHIVERFEKVIGRLLAHHRIVEPIGAGGMGVVCRAREEHLLRDAATKVLPAGALAATLFLMPGAAAIAGPPGGTKGWIRVETDHFTLFSGAPQKRTMEIASSLEAFRDTLTRFHPGFSFDPHETMGIYVFGNRATFLPYAPSELSMSADIAGYYMPTADANFMALNAAAVSGLGVVLHEYTHAFIARNLPMAPGWFREGLSDCYATFKLDGNHGELGLPNASDLRVLARHLPLSLQDLLGRDHAPASTDAGRWELEFQAESWAFMHYLLWGSPERRPQMAAFLQALERGTAMDEAFGDAFHADYKTIEDELRRYVFKDQYPYMKMTFPGLNVAQPRVWPMARDEVLVHLGELLAQAFPDRLASADEHFREAARLNPNNARAHAGLGYLCYTKDRSARAIARYAVAYRLAPDDAAISQYYGAVLLDRLFWKSPDEQWGEAETGRLVAEARDLAARAIRLKPEYQPAYVTLGRCHLVGGDDAAGIAAFETAMRLRPWDMNTALMLVFLETRSGRMDDARAAVDRYLARDPLMAQLGRTILSLPDPGAVAAPRTGERVDRDLALDEAALAAATDEQVRTALKRMIKWIHDRQDGQKMIRDFDRAEALLEAGDAAGAAALLEPLTHGVTDPTLAADARDALAGLKKR